MIRGDQERTRYCRDCEYWQSNEYDESWCRLNGKKRPAKHRKCENYKEEDEL